MVGTAVAGRADAVAAAALPCSGVGVGLPTAGLFYPDGTPRSTVHDPVGAGRPQQVVFDG